jgi:hypothetical protein
MKCVPVVFVGFRGDEYISAVKVWGKPDIIIKWATWTNMGELNAHAVVIIGPKAFQMPDKWRRKTGWYAHAVPPV